LRKYGLIDLPKKQRRPNSQYYSIMQAELLEQALIVIPVPQVLVNIVSQRVRQLSQGARPMVEVELKMGLADIALQEVIHGKLTCEQMAEATVVVPLPVAARRSPQKKAA
jgi:DNA-directed RNA polymerase subunit omega